MLYNFSANFESLANISATSTVAVEAMLAGSSGIVTDIMLVNTGTKTAFIKFGDATVDVEATTGMAILPGEKIILDFGLNTHVAVITAGSDTTTLQAIIGRGM